MDGGDCVEVAEGVAGGVPVRDSKNPGPVVVVPKGAWRVFVRQVRG